MRQNLNMIEILTELSKRLPSVQFQKGDLNDIGNEVGFHLGHIIKDMTDDEIKNFISGFKHGVSLTNGTHP